MSWRILIKPAAFDDAPDDAADWVIPLNATDEQIGEIAEEAAWSWPLTIITPHENDPRYQSLLQLLDEVYGVGGDEYVTVVKKPKEEKQ